VSAPAIPSRVFRDAVSEFATGVTVVCAEHDGRPAGMTLNAFSSVSLDPLLVLVSLGHGSRTLAAVHGSGRLSISVLHRAQQAVAIAFAERGAPFAAEHVVRTSDGFLVVAGAAATHHCTVHEIVRAGDHDLVIGEVVGMSHHGGEPLIFHRGRFGGLATDRFVPPGHPISLDEGAGW
jgi:flavin reductase (DIM6/NTAB) family NADH-FMN oxidoreductase RutF